MLRQGSAREHLRRSVGREEGAASATASQNTRITEPIRKLRGVVGQSRSQRPRRATVRGRERTAFIPPAPEGAG